MSAGPVPQLLWIPDAEHVRNANLTAFVRFAEDHTGRRFPTYAQLWDWSVTDLPTFWTVLWKFYRLTERFGAGGIPLAETTMPGARWFPDAQVNFAECALEVGADDDLAIVEAGEDGVGRRLNRADLRREVAALAGRLRDWGVTSGDVVAGYLPNISACVVGMLAAATVGAIWSSVGQDYAPDAAADRLAQLSPTVLITADGYRYGGRWHDRRAAAAELLKRLPAVGHVVCVQRGDAAPAGGWTTWPDAVTHAQVTAPDRLAFEHPLWVLFSSGTTGIPKGIVHGHGGILLEMYKQLGLHWNLTPGDLVFWYTSPSWVMWNLQAAALIHGAAIVCYDGSPTYPSPARLWTLVRDLSVTFFGTSPGFLQSTQSAGVKPGELLHGSALEAIGSTGSPLPRRLHDWVTHQLPYVPVYSMSGGTDIASAFFGGVPTEPVWAGELTARCLGVDAHAWSASGIPVVDQLGELVVTSPMPSMPLRFWNDDPSDTRYRDAYFTTFPGVWRHGDWISITSRGTVIVHGRSDSTLNRNGIRMGSADIYAAVESLPGITEALVIGAELGDGEYWMPLFVALQPGRELTEQLRADIIQAIRTKASPRHVPDDILAVPGVPHTRTGKKLEVPVKRILRGADPTEVVSPAAVDQPGLLDVFVEARPPSSANPHADGS